MPAITVADLAGVVYSSGKVFDGLNTGRLRTQDQQIGVQTRHGRHAPDAMTDSDLQRLIARAKGGEDPCENALGLFVELAKAQPFEDGNKRTALFVANSLLISAKTRKLLVIPVDDNDSSHSDSFNDLLARAYIRGEHEAVKGLLRTRGFTALDNGGGTPS